MVNESESVRDDLLSKAKEYESFVLMIEKVDQTDFTFFQLLVSFHEYCKKSNKSMKFRKTKQSESVKTMINKLGFDKITLNNI